MKKLLTLTMAVLFSATVLGANASWLSETNKALNRANTTMDTVNKIDTNIKKAKTKKRKTKAERKAAVKNAAKSEAKNQASKAIDKLFE